MAASDEDAAAAAAVAGREGGGGGGGGGACHCGGGGGSGGSCDGDDDNDIRAARPPGVALCVALYRLEAGMDLPKVKRFTGPMIGGLAAQQAKGLLLEGRGIRVVRDKIDRASDTAHCC
jgi:hypothetical protein